MYGREDVLRRVEQEMKTMANAFRVSEACTLALHTMVLLARNKEASHTTREIAETFHASEATLSKVLQRLHKAGLVRSVRGPKGGFRLARPADEVRLLDVYETIEGSLTLSRCLFETPMCGADECIMGDLIERMNAEVRDYLARTRLADLDGVFDNLLEKATANA